MPFDAIFLSAVTQELQPFTVGTRIDKVQQPTRDTILLSLRSREGNYRLLLSASANHPRIHLTQAKYEQPAQPPMFCMLLRKHLTGGRIRSLTQLPAERAVDLCMECTDELGELSDRHLYLELMGRNSNLILTGADGRIIDCLRRVDFAMSEKRQVLPGLFYREPPTQGKTDPLTAEEETVRSLLSAVTFSKRLDQWLTETFAGISPLVARELSFRTTGETDTDILSADKAALSAALRKELSELLRVPVPVLLLEGGTPKDFSYRDILQYGDYMQRQTAESFSALLDAFYSGREQAERMRSRSQVLQKTVSNLYARVVRKLELQRKELEATYGRERLRQLGDIVTANLYRMQRGQAQLTAVDFYDPEMQEITVPLNVALSPQQNAAKFYKDYTRAKNAEKILKEQISAGEREQVYLASILDELARAETERDLVDIRAELLDGGYLRDTEKKRMKTPPSRPMAFTSSDGFAIYVGRNNRQNDELTCRLAHKTDLWLHTQKIHGSHVIIATDGQTPPDRTVTEAAMLAVWYSQARLGQNVPVDYCPVRQVKKPAGAKPGMVVYENYTTCYVTPDSTLPQRLSGRPEEL